MSGQIVGLNELLTKLDTILDENTISKGLEKSCLLVEGSAKQKAPKDTGALRRSITTEVDGLKGKIFTPLEYAPYIEYGTGLFAEHGGRKDVPWHYQDDEGNWHSTNGQKPKPFLRPALEENRKDIVEVIKGEILNNG